MTQRDHSDRRGVWSRYWATGSPHSCGTSYDSTYGGRIGAFWRDAFAGLRPGERVLDIATGNAALPRLLIDACPQVGVECDAVDLAQVAPAWLGELAAPQRQRVRIHCGVSAESLPFADGVFDLAISQYGIEYADLSRAVPELLRVLAPGGRVRILAHHARSRPVVLAGDEIGHIDWLLRDAGLLELAADLIDPMASAATPEGRARLATDEAANLMRRRFNDEQRALSSRLADAPCPDVLHEARDCVAQVFALAGARGRTPAQALLAKLRGELADSRLRLAELCSHALDDADVARLCEALGRHGARTAAVPLSDEGHLLGWAVSGDPAA